MAEGKGETVYPQQPWEQRSTRTCPRMHHRTEKKQEKSPRGEKASCYRGKEQTLFGALLPLMLPRNVEERRGSVEKRVGGSGSNQRGTQRKGVLRAGCEKIARIVYNALEATWADHIASTFLATLPAPRGSSPGHLNPPHPTAGVTSAPAGREGCSPRGQQSLAHFVTPPLPRVPRGERKGGERARELGLGLAPPPLSHLLTRGGTRLSPVRTGHPRPRWPITARCTSLKALRRGSHAAAVRRAPPSRPRAPTLAGWRDARPAPDTPER